MVDEEPIEGEVAPAESKKLTDGGRELVTTHLRLAVRIAWRWHNRTGIDPDDLIDLAIVTLCEAAAEYRPGPQGFGSFAYGRITRAIRHDRQRARRRDRMLTRQPSSRLALCEAMNTLDDSEDVSSVWQAFRQLNDADQDILTRSVWHEHTLEEIGHDRGISESGVSRAVNRALRRLREQMDNP